MGGKGERRRERRREDGGEEGREDGTEEGTEEGEKGRSGEGKSGGERGREGESGGERGRSALLFNMSAREKPRTTNISMHVFL